MTRGTVHGVSAREADCTVASRTSVALQAPTFFYYLYSFLQRFCWLLVVVEKMDVEALSSACKRNGYKYRASQVLSRLIASYLACSLGLASLSTGSQHSHSLYSPKYWL